MWCKAEFSALSVQSSASHDPSEIIPIYRFAAPETLILMINAKNSLNVTFDQFNASLLKKIIISY